MRRSIADVIAPPRREHLDESGDEVREVRSGEGSDARFDAARERLKSSVARRDDDHGEPTQ